jgi:hypothetical protein
VLEANDENRSQLFSPLPNVEVLVYVLTPPGERAKRAAWAKRRWERVSGGPLTSLPMPPRLGGKPALLGVACVRIYSNNDPARRRKACGEKFQKTVSAPLGMRLKPGSPEREYIAYPNLRKARWLFPTSNPVVCLEQIKSFLEEGLPLLGTTPVQKEAAERTEEPIPNLRFRRRLPKSRSAIHVFMVFRTALWVLRAGVQLIDERMSVR